MRHSTLLRVVDSSVDAIIQVGGDGCIRKANASAEEMFDYPNGALQGCYFTAIVPPDQNAELSHALRATLAGERPRPFEIVAQRRDGAHVHVSIALSAARSSDGGVTGAVAIIRDITELIHDTEQACQRQRLEAVGRLAGSIAHDFNNFLMAILGRAEIALSELPDPHPVRAELDEIVTVVSRASELTAQLLAFSRERTFSPRTLYPSDVISRVARLMDRLLPEHVRVRVDGGSAGAVRMDAGQLEQVVVNIAVNGSDAMPNGGTLRLHTEDVSFDGDETIKPGDYVVIRVTDTGTGMSDEVRWRAVDPFFTTKPIGEGAGLGLSVAYGIVSRADGHLIVHSREGVGTVVEIWLPRVTPSDRVTRQRVATSPATATVVVVEDDPSVRAIAVRILRRQQYNVLEARNGAEAIELVERHAGVIDAALTDAVMPVMGGHEFIERLRALRPDCRVILMSGYRGGDDVEGLLALDRIEFLRKPFNAETLVRAVSDLLAR